MIVTSCTCMCVFNFLIFCLLTGKIGKLSLICTLNLPMTAFLRSVSASFSITFCFCCAINSLVFSPSLRGIPYIDLSKHLLQRQMCLYIIKLNSHKVCWPACIPLDVSSVYTDTHVLTCFHNYDVWFLESLVL